MSHKLVNKFKALEGFGLTFVKTLGRSCPDYSVRTWIIVDFIGTGCATNDKLPEGFSIGFAEQPCLALDTKTGLRILGIVKTHCRYGHNPRNEFEQRP